MSRPEAWLRRSLVVYAAAFMLLVALHPNHAWMSPETTGYSRPYTLANGRALSRDDVTRGLNYVVMENGAARAFRPMSSWFEIVDSKLRATLWQWVRPHPTLSLTFLFTLILSPLLLTRLLRNLGLGAYAVAGTVLYMLSISGLSFLSLHFRPAKPITNFSIICALYAISTRVGRSGDTPARAARFWVPFALGVYLSLFFDETAFLVFFFLFLIFPKYLLARWWRWGTLAATLVAGLATLAWGLPALTAAAGFPAPDPSTWEPFQNSSLIQEWLTNLLPNAWLVVRDIFGVPHLKFWSSMPVFEKIFWPAHVLLLLTVAVSVLAKFRHRDLRRTFPWLLCLGLAGLIGVHTLLMCAVSNKIWNTYWYGTYIAVLSPLLLLRVLKWLEWPAWRVLIVCSSIALSTSLSFVYVNDAYKARHYDQYAPLLLREYFTGQRNIYRAYQTQPRPDYPALTSAAWHTWQTKGCLDPELPSPLLSYLRVELLPNHPCSAAELR